MQSVYEKQWSRYKKLKWATAISFLGFLPTVAIMGFVATEVFQKRIPDAASGVFVLLWFLSCVFLAYFFSSWSCPRCGRPFVRYRNVALWTKRCVHCGLPKYSDPLNPTNKT